MVQRASHGGNTCEDQKTGETIKRKRNGINTSYSRKLRRKLRKNPELVKSLKRLLKCKSKSK